jgi:hypothetical protein
MGELNHRPAIVQRLTMVRTILRREDAIRTLGGFERTVAGIWLVHPRKQVIEIAILVTIETKRRLAYDSRFNELFSHFSVIVSASAHGRKNGNEKHDSKSI